MPAVNVSEVAMVMDHVDQDGNQKDGIIKPVFPVPCCPSMMQRKPDQNTCPFCNSTNLIIEFNNGEAGVLCLECGASGISKELLVSEYQITLCNGQKKMVKLKSCPFCGYAEPRIEEIPYDGYKQYAAVCPSCGASTSEYEARGTAIFQWNMRDKED